MPHKDFCDLMRKSNKAQKELLMHVVHNLLTPHSKPLQIFFTGPAGAGKTFVIKLMMEIYNRFTDTDGYCNAYITCASTGKAAVAIDGTTVHTALKITLSKLIPLSHETCLQYRTLFKFVKVLIIDEVSMIGAEMLAQIDQRLKQITGNFEVNFGGIDIILIGDLRQLPPVRATPIYRQRKQRLGEPFLWRDLKFFELTEVMRQSNTAFSNILTKLGNGEILDPDQLQLLEARFYSREEADRLCPHGVRLFLTNHSVSQYNMSALDGAEEKVTSEAVDIFRGCSNAQEEATFRQKLHKLSVIDTGGLPYEITFVLNKPYMITTNIDVSDGLANGALGHLVFVEKDNEGKVTRVWLDFPDSQKTGRKIRTKAAGFMRDNGIKNTAVPISRRNTNITMNKNKSVHAIRNQFPLAAACAMTIHKSQGGTFDNVVYEYEKSHSQSLLYVALSRVTSIEGLFIVPKNNNDRKFYHGRHTSAGMEDLQREFRRLALNRLETATQVLSEFMGKRKGFSLFSLNCQSLRAHAGDFNDPVAQNSNVLLLSETWMNNREPLDILNFNCIVHLKRENSRAGGVAIYQNRNDTANVFTNNLDITLRNLNTVTVSHGAVGDICAAQCRLENGQELMLIVVYFPPHSRVPDIIDFIHQSLLAYTPMGSAALGKKLHELPMLLSGDFNVNFASDESRVLVDFLKEKLLLDLSNDPREPTTRHGTTLDAVFARFINRLESQVFISYFSYHKPIVSFIDYNADEPNED